ncbi:hypothetical protein BKA61DRAFT_482016 [Leptodontidium sp. MPI-SDFR-AT-0119]|nr:hypothetical protein BKA61DRAFT_482016 [Leptodontidium sp. MPI-SDFR-AT-0119]
MRLLQYNNDGDFSLTEFFEGDIPKKHAILSHIWGAEDLTDGKSKGKTGYGKIQFCREHAKRDDLQYFWVDTCCIDKSNVIFTWLLSSSLFFFIFLFFFKITGFSESAHSIFCSPVFHTRGVK